MPFEGEGFNFSSKYIVKYDGNENGDTGVFTINKSDLTENELNFHKSFYKTNQEFINSNIGLNVTCFVGKNGSGKSLLIRKLFKNFQKEKISEIKQEKLIIIQDNKNKLFYYSNFNPKFSNKCVSKPVRNNKIEEFFAQIYYNPYFDDHAYETEKINRLENDDINDISTNYLIYNSTESIEYKNNVVYGNIEQEKFDVYISNEMKRKLNFYFDENNNYFLDSHFKDNKLSRNCFKFRSSDYNYWIYQNELDKQNKINKEENKYTEIEELINYIDKKYIGNNKLFVWHIIRDIFLSLVLTISDNSKGKIQINPNYKEYNYENIPFYTLFEKLVSIFNKSQFEIISEKCNNAKDAIKQLIKVFNELENYIKLDWPYLSIQLVFDDELEKNKIKQSINNIFNIELKIRSIFERSPFLMFGYEPKLSSGEDSLITLYSRFFELFISKSKEIFSKESILICIDEGEKGYHPEWKKQYIKSILVYIQYLILRFKPDDNKLKNIHIFLATNSPILLSDILPQDVIYLENMKLCNNKREHAFGSNILDLYSDNFFIQDGLIGSFAQKKISDLLFRVSKDEFVPNQEDILLIENIGDINIRNYLRALYNGAKNKFYAKNGDSND